MDTETSMVFAHASERKGADSDTVDSMMGDIKLLATDISCSGATKITQLRRRRER